MKRVVADASPGEPGKRRGADRPAEGVGQAETDIVQQDDELWSQWRVSIIDALQWMHAKHITETEKS
jgi:hypothetical protein